MIDPFSIATGLAGLFSLSIEVLKILDGFVSDWKDVPNDIESFKKELDHLVATVRETNKILPQSLAPVVDGSLTSEDYVASCMAELSKLRDSLIVDKKAALSKIWDRIKRAIRPEALKRSITEMNRYCEQLNRDITNEILKVSTTSIERVASIQGTLSTRYREEDETKILSWISTMNFRERHEDLLQKHHEGTGEWLLEREDFMDWRNGVEINSEENEVPLIFWCWGMRT